MWRALLGVALAFLATPPSSATDLLILAGGERRSGALTSCDDERCQFDGAPVALADLLWIGLGIGGGDEELPRAVASPGAILVDGSLTAGKIVGLSQGTIVLDTAELERSAVRWVRVAAVPPLVDVLVRRDGALRSGALQGCAAGSCTMAGVAATRAELAWVGLAVSPETMVLPAAPQDPARDQAQFADGATRATPLIGIGAGDVVLGSGTFPRAEVAWIYLAPPAQAPGPPVIRDPPAPAPPSGPPGGQPPGPPRPQGEPPTRPPEPPTPSGVAVCDPRNGMVAGSGELWTGTARMFESMRGPGWAHEDTSNFEVRLREVCEAAILDLSVTPPRRIGTVIWLDDGGTVQHDHLFEASAAGCPCDGERTFIEPAGPGGAIYRRTGAGDSSAFLAFDLPAQPFYSLKISNSGEIIEVPCAAGPCAGRTSRTLMQFHAGRYPNVSAETSWDPEMRSPAGGILRGSYTKPLGPATLEVSWSICRAGVQCPPLPEPPGGGGTSPPPPPPPEEDSCGDLAQERALVDVLWQQRQAYSAELKVKWDALALAHGEMLDDVEAYRAALDVCAIWDIVGETLESSAEWGGDFTEFVTKILSGDLSAFVRSEGDNLWGTLAERAWDAFPRQSTWAGNMQDRISGCNAPISHDLRVAALRFVDNWERVRGLMPTVQEQINRIRDQDLRYWEKWQRLYQTCLQWAQCKGVPPANCPQPPEQPSGPMPPAPPG